MIVEIGNNFSPLGFTLSNSIDNENSRKVLLEEYAHVVFGVIKLVYIMTASTFTV